MATTVSTSFETNAKFTYWSEVLKDRGYSILFQQWPHQSTLPGARKYPESSERLIILVMRGSSTSTHSLRSLAGIGSRGQDFLDEVVIRSNTSDSDNGGSRGGTGYSFSLRVNSRNFWGNTLTPVTSYISLR